MRCQCNHRIEEHVIRASGRTWCKGGPAKCDCVCFSRSKDERASGPLRYKDGRIVDRNGREYDLPPNESMQWTKEEIAERMKFITGSEIERRNALHHQAEQDLIKAEWEYRLAYQRAVMKAMIDAGAKHFEQRDVRDLGAA